MRPLLRSLSLLALVTLFVTALAAQTSEFVRAFEAAQRLRPAQVSSKARIAPATEPGSPLVIHGRVFKDDARTPAPDVVVFAYQTDASGLYDRGGGNLSWRLKGWAKTDAEGRFEFTTIKPGPYPGEQIASHVHFNLLPADGGRYHAGELLFEGDPRLTSRQKDQSAGAGIFAEIRPIRREGGAEHVEINLKINPAGKF
jgi:protocatechuate 3,4-dioxygenase beta subunit